MAGMVRGRDGEVSAINAELRGETGGGNLMGFRYLGRPFQNLKRFLDILASLGAAIR